MAAWHSSGAMRVVSREDEGSPVLAAGPISRFSASACGTPVIAMRRGSMPEIIDHHLSGFLVDDLDEAIAAIGQIGSIDRRLTRKTVERRFSVERMASDYLELYRRILPGHGARRLEEVLTA